MFIHLEMRKIMSQEPFDISNNAAESNLAPSHAYVSKKTKKEDVTAELKDGYLTIHATSNQNKDEKDEDGKYIRRERYSGSCNRSFYVGDAVTEEDIKASFENGTLKMTIPKKEAKAVPEKKFISIEG